MGSCPVIGMGARSMSAGRLTALYLLVATAACSRPAPSAAKRKDARSTAVAPTPSPAPKMLPPPAPTRAVLAGTIHVRGKVTLEPVVGLDPYCAKVYPGRNRTVIGPGGVLANTLVHIAEGVPGRYSPPDEPHIVRQIGCRFEPRVALVMVGQKLVITNEDDTLHAVEMVGRSGTRFDIAMLRNTKPKVHIIRDRPELVFLGCDTHDWMAAYLLIKRHPFFAVTDGRGQFEIKNLPAGTYTLEAWHERFGIQRRKVTVNEDEVVRQDFVFKSTDRRR